ncbi:hypothetical protein Kisp01_53500 [Kineosporia sp. NBRC 101677]|uniref:DUF2975 domain-containing protein n=1 Tax=Kineosporia sp. NBRC 101677 TaxID=3032197 RepID=UPI0024A0B4CD|nr:DUF2975 domain-containing protein [Kineosporia sp. NBRC 101677]GLY18336.1 hypothetical protein Kisp01_53500 [Kineosporia sp. NBRC 101677]
MRLGAFVIERDPVYVGTRSLQIISHTLALVGVIALGASAVLLGASVFRSHQSIDLPVQLQDTAVVARVGDFVTQNARTRAELAVSDGELALKVIDPPRLEILLGNAGPILLGLAIGISAFLLRPVLLSVANAQPFRPGNARRLAHVAVVTTCAAVLVPVSPALTTMFALDRLGLTGGREGGDSPFVFGVSFSLTLVIVLPVVLLVLAEAFRQGEKLHRDVEGLV